MKSEMPVAYCFSASGANMAISVWILSAFRVEFFPGTGVIVLQQVPYLASGTLQMTKDGQGNPSQCFLDSLLPIRPARR